MTGKNPTLGAWGLGWEVWLNGMEVTQFTYFQQVGGLNCKPVLGEITYGIERLAMYLQGVENVYDLTWTTWKETKEGQQGQQGQQGQPESQDRHLSYGDVFHQNEVEQSIYNFEASNPTLLFSLFNHYEAEAQRLLAAPLVLPAYEMILKAAHTFNLLDARGAISVTETRGLYWPDSVLCRDWLRRPYFAEREKLGFPMLKGQVLAEQVLT